jgi:hypothetical protein
MIIHDLDACRSALGPFKTNAVLVIDADAVLAGSFSFKRFEPVTRRYAQIVERCRRIDLIELAKGGFPKMFWQEPSRRCRVDAVKDILGGFIGERLDHRKHNSTDVML